MSTAPLPCVGCRADLPPDARFCPRCGKATGAPASIAPSAVLDRFVPPEIAERIRQSGGRLEGERRPVTVLFADLSGFTAMSEKLDPEEVVEITNACLSALVDVVHAHDGVIDKFIGDEVMALFGAPIAHEDDAVRAIRAALAMKDALGTFNERFAPRLPRPLRLHCGLHCGEVVAGAVGHDDRASWSVMGDTVNVAARLADASEPGEIFCSARTRALARGHVEFVAKPALHAKGKSRPLEVWDAVALGTPPVLPIDGPLVGREPELASLRDAWALAVRGAGRPLLVTGDAGIGKTRLVAALAVEVEGRVCAVRAGSHPAPFGAATALARAVIGGTPHDDDATARDHLARHLLTRPIDPAQHDAVHALCGLSPGAEPVGIARRVVAFAALLAAARRPVLLAIEDLHAADPSSRELLLGLARGWQDPRAMWLATWRDTEEPAPAGVTVLRLAPLAPAAAAGLADREAPLPLPPEVHRFLADRAAGNPLYLRQLVRGLLESGALVEVADGWRVALEAHAPLPAGEASPILARIDRLDHAGREVLKVAAVLGVELPSALLADVAGRDPTATVDRLCAAGFLVRHPEAWADVAFTHAMIREVALASLLKDRRRKLHRAAVAAIDARWPDLVEHRPEFLLAQLEGAGDAPRAAAVSKAVIAAIRRDAGEVDPAAAARDAALARAARDERKPLPETLMNLAWVVANLGSIAVLVVVYAVMFDLVLAAVTVAMLGSLALGSVFMVMPWWTLRSVAVDDDGVVLHRQLGRPIALPWDEIAVVRWHRAPRLATTMRILLLPAFYGRTGDIWRQSRVWFLNELPVIEIERRMGRSVWLYTVEDRATFHLLTDVISARAREGRTVPAVDGTHGPYDAVRRTWVRTSDGEDLGALSYDEVVSRVARGELGPDDRVAPATAGERAWETVESASHRDARLGHALRPHRAFLRPTGILVAACVLTAFVPTVCALVWWDVWGSLVPITALTAIPHFLAFAAVSLVVVGVEAAARSGMSSVARRALATAAGALIGAGWLASFAFTFGPVIEATLDPRLGWLSPVPPTARPLLHAATSRPFAEWHPTAAPVLARYDGTTGGFLLHTLAMVGSRQLADPAARLAVTERALAVYPRSWVFLATFAGDACDARAWSRAVPALARLTILGDRLGAPRRACLALGLLEQGDREAALAALDRAHGAAGDWAAVSLAWARLRPDDIDGFSRFLPDSRGWNRLADALEAEGRDASAARERATP